MAIDPLAEWKFAHRLHEREEANGTAMGIMEITHVMSTGPEFVCVCGARWPEKVFDTPIAWVRDESAVRTRRSGRNRDAEYRKIAEELAKAILPLASLETQDRLADEWARLFKRVAEEPPDGTLSSDQILKFLTDSEGSI